MWLSTLLWGFGMMSFLYIQPLYVASLGASSSQIGLVLGASGIFVTFLYIPIGLWADRYGRKPVILAGWGLGAAATLAMAFVPDWRWLIPAMSVYMFSNFALPAFNGYLAASEAGGNLGRAIAIINTSSIGGVIAPAVGGWIGEQYGLRAVYFTAGVMFCLSTLVLVFLAPQPATPPTTASRTPRELLGNRAFLWQIAFVFLLYFSLEISHIMAPKFLEDVRGLRVGQIGWLGSVASLGVVILQLLLGQLPTERRLSLLLVQLVALVATAIWLNTSLLFLIVIAYFMHGYNRLVRPIIVGRLSHSLDPATLSFGYGFYETSFRLGLAVAPYVAGLLYEHSPGWPLLAGIMCLSVTLVLTFTLPTKGKQTVSATQLAGSHGN
jgi:MFS family permease